MADTLLFRGGSSASIDVASIQSRELAIDTDTDQIVSGPSRKKTVMEDSDGRVGIGTSSPQGPLHVAASGGSSIRLQDSNSNAGINSALIVADGTTALKLQASAGTTAKAITFFRSNTDEAMRINPSGDVLIGGTLPSAPNIILEESGKGEFLSPSIVGLRVGNINSTADHGLRLQRQSDGNSAVKYYSDIYTTNEGLKLGSGTGSSNIRSNPIALKTDGALCIGNVADSVAAPNIKLNANGSASFEGAVGIGTTSPQEELDVTGSLIVQNRIGNNITVSTTVDNGNDSHFKFQKARGGVNGPTQISATDLLGAVEWHGYDGTGYNKASSITTQASTNTGDFDAKLIYAADQHVFTTTGESLRIASDGNITAAGDIKIGGTLPASPNITLNANGSITAAGSAAFGEYATGDYVQINAGGVVEVKRDGSNSNDVAIQVYSDGTTPANRKFTVATDGTTSIGGTLPSAPNIELKADGSITAAGEIKVNNGRLSLIKSPSGSANSNTLIIYDTYTATGAKASFKADGSLFIGGSNIAAAQNAASPNIKLSEDGSITAAGNVGIGSFDALSGNWVSIGSDTVARVALKCTDGAGKTWSLLSGNAGQLGAYDHTNNKYGAYLSTDGNLLLGGTLPSAPNIELNTDGSITAAGNVQADGYFSAGGNPSGGVADGARLYAGGGIYASGTSRDLWRGYATGSGTPTSAITADGSAEFAGDITCTDNSKGLILKSPDGSSFRLSVANDGTLSATSI